MHELIIICFTEKYIVSKKGINYVIGVYSYSFTVVKYILFHRLFLFRDCIISLKCIILILYNYFFYFGIINNIFNTFLKLLIYLKYINLSKVVLVVVYSFYLA